jgi:DNA polymerase-3 subunit gamma/tau
MGDALYRKYRSKKLSEIIGQEHITDTLSEALKRGKISHAYLFTGPRGVGKTSIARILAHEINQLPYIDDAPHIDIIEIDAASNRRIDEIRDLREKVYVAPVSAKYKVYIIDEVHMLTREAFNALLKTLEEPPAHVIFILATTDAHKLPDTIVSRTQRYSFKPVGMSKVAAHLKTIAKEEKIDIEDDALEFLAEHGEGSFRDSISLLDQAGSRGTKLTLSDIQLLLGIPPEAAVTALLKAFESGSEPSELLAHLQRLYDQGFQAPAVAKQLAGAARGHIIESSGNVTDEVYALLTELLEVPVAHDPARYLELVLLTTRPGKVSQTTPSPVAAPAPRQAKPAEPEPEKPKSKNTEAKKEESVVAKAKEEPELTETAETPVEKASFDISLWPEILEALKKKYNTLYGVIRMAEPSFTEDGSLKLSFKFAFHQKRISEPGNRQILIGIIKELTGHAVSIECVYDKSAKPVKPETVAATPAKPDTIQSISNIFGGGELLES